MVTSNRRSIGEQPDAATADLAVLLSHEHGRQDHPLVEALLALRFGDYPDKIQHAAGRTLRRAAPWALDLAPVLHDLLFSAGDERAAGLFVASISFDPPSQETMGEQLGISGPRVNQILKQFGQRLRAALPSAPHPLPWVVEQARTQLGPIVEMDAARAFLARLGLVGQLSDVVLWLAGPYRRVATQPGWLAITPAAAVSATKTALAVDGGVRQLVEVLEEIGIHRRHAPAWLRAWDCVVVHELAVSVSGPLPAVIERILEAEGRPLRLADLHTRLEEGGRPVGTDSLLVALRDRRFRRDSATGVCSLADWEASGSDPSDGPAVADVAEDDRAPSPASISRCDRDGAAAEVPEGEAAGRRSGVRGTGPEASRDGLVSSGGRPEGGHTPAAPRQEADGAAVGGPASVAGSGAGDRVWLWVRVDAAALRGDEGPVPAPVIEALGLAPSSHKRFCACGGSVLLAYGATGPTRGSIRPVALAAGAREGDTVLLGFAKSGNDVAVEVRPSGGAGEPPPAAAARSEGIDGRRQSSGGGR